MNRDGLEQILAEASDIANAREPERRPWPVVLLTTLGAWLATVPSAGLALPHSWQRTTLGVTSAAALMLYAARNYGFSLPRGTGLRTLLHLQAALWLLGRELAGRPHAALRLLPFLDGWLAMALLGMVYWSGPAFLAPGLLELAETATPFLARPLPMHAVSLACVVAGAVVLARALPALRQGWCLGVAITLGAFVGFMPGLGVVLLIAACCIADSRYSLACAAGLAAVWTIGSAYYDLALPLVQKAILFAAVGAAIVAFSWRPLRAVARMPATRRQLVGARAGRVCLLASGAITLALANAGMLRNEMLIAKSEPAYIELRPADPRSLVQGDYMRLAFQVPPESPEDQYVSNQALAVARRGADNITQLVRWHDRARALGQGEFLIELENKNGRWMLASDAWFFREGEARRFEAARYGEFRISPQGRALLVGLRGPRLEPL